MTNQLLTFFLTFLSAALAPPAQLSAPNETGVAMGHLHYNVQDVASNRDFWVTLGGEAVEPLGTTEVVKFPDVLVLLSERESEGNTEGSVVNHVAFRVESLEEVEASGLEIERLEGYVGIASVFTPEGERIELFDETATNLGFTIDDGVSDSVADRHNQPITAPIIAHHIHLYLPESAVAEAKEWYGRMFGGTPGTRWRYDAVDLPGINFNFSSASEAQAPTQGRMLDHIGFEVENLDAFCARLEAEGIEFDLPYTARPSGLAIAFITDPWGTRIELTEGLDGL